jgi:nucleoside-diphosphate-sugar epimerase
MRNAIIGAQGFIGSALKRYADKFREEEWVGINRQNYKDYIDQTFDVVIWAAGAASKRMSREDLARDHILGVHLALRDFKHTTFVYISSQAVYEKCQDSKAKESFPVRPHKLSDYAWAKYMGEKALKSEREKRWIVVRPNGFTGPGLKKNVVFDLARTPPQLFVSWDSRIQYMHVDKFAEIMLDHIQCGASNYICNVTTKDSITPAEIANILRVDLKDVKMPADQIIPRIDANIDVTRTERYLNIQMPLCSEAILNWNKPLY